MQTAREVYHARRRSHAFRLPRVEVADVNHEINARALLASKIDGYVKGGRVGVIRAGRACDGSFYSRRYNVNGTSLFRLCMQEQEHRELLDGPEETYFVAPAHTGLWALPPRDPTVMQLAVEALKAKRSGSPNADAAAKAFLMALMAKTDLDEDILAVLRTEGLLP